MLGLAANLSQNIGPKLFNTLSKQIQLEVNPKKFQIVLKQ